MKISHVLDKIGSFFLLAASVSMLLDDDHLALNLVVFSLVFVLLARPIR